MDTFDITKKILSEVMELTDIEEISCNKILKETPLRDFGIDSFGLMKIVIGLESELKIEIDFEKIDLKEFGTYNSLVDFIKKTIDA